MWQTPFDPSASSVQPQQQQQQLLAEPICNRTENGDHLRASRKCYRYVRRMLKFDQMDFEFALWQMVYLFVAPHQVYRNFSYRKQMKSQFARDDPAFFLLFVLCLSVTALGYSWLFDFNARESIVLLLYVIVVDCTLAALAVTSAMWLVMNGLQRLVSCAFTDVALDELQPSIEWGYAFDVHLNASFPGLSVLHLLHLVLYNCLLGKPWFISRLAGNTLWLCASIYYAYMTFLGYHHVLNMRCSKLILVAYPMLFLLYVIATLTGCHISAIYINFYKDRVHSKAA